MRKILQREGLLSIKHDDRSGAVRDADVVAKNIAELRAKYLNSYEIGAQLTREHLRPSVGAKWLAQTVAQPWNVTTT